MQCSGDKNVGYLIFTITIFTQICTPFHTEPSICLITRLLNLFQSCTYSNVEELPSPDSPPLEELSRPGSAPPENIQDIRSTPVKRGKQTSPQVKVNSKVF